MAFHNNSCEEPLNVKQPQLPDVRPESILGQHTHLNQLRLIMHCSHGPQDKY